MLLSSPAPLLLVILWHTDRRLVTGRGRLVTGRGRLVTGRGRLVTGRGSQRGWCPNLCPKHASREPQQYPWLNYCRLRRQSSHCTPNGIAEHEEHTDGGNGTQPQGDPVDKPTPRILCHVATNADANTDEDDRAIR